MPIVQRHATTWFAGWMPNVISPSKRLVHYHIFKNAGSSVDHALKKYFVDRWADFEGSHAHDVKTVDQLRDFLAERPQLRAVSTHLGKPPLPDASTLPIVFLRHPIARLQSVFTFTKGDRSQPNSELLQTFSLADYVRWAFGEGRDKGGIVVRNYQVVHLSAASFRSMILEAEAGPHDLAQAIDLLESWGIFGIVEQFGESCARFERRIRETFVDFAFETAWINRTMSEETGLERQLAAVRNLLGDRLYRTVEEENALDLALYDWACRRFAEQTRARH